MKKSVVGRINDVANHVGNKVRPADVLDYIKTIVRFWPVLVGILALAFWMGGRIESPDEKQNRIDAALAPINVRLQHIEAKIDSTMEVEQEETEILGRLTDAVVKYIDHQLGKHP